MFYSPPSPRKNPGWIGLGKGVKYVVLWLDDLIKEERERDGVL